MPTRHTRRRVLSAPRLLVNLRKIEENARAVVRMLGGIDVVGVTKCMIGAPGVAHAMLDGGAVAVAESRHAGAQRLRDGGITAPIWLLRMPSPLQALETIHLFELSLASEIETCRALDTAASQLGVRHQVIVMIELGDLREGIMPRDLPAFVSALDELEHLEFVGIGTNLTCYGAIVPDDKNMGELVSLARRMEKRVGHPLLVSGGNSSAVHLVRSGGMPAGIDSLRIGETILHGLDTLTRWPIDGLHTDAFVLEAPVIESRLKPSRPYGGTAQTAWGDTPVFEDRGVRHRAICAVGRQDCRVESLTPLDPRAYILGASSDHLVLDIDAMIDPPRPGEALSFRPDYVATVQLATSPFVEKVFLSTT
jgi:ornithine racemase